MDITALFPYSATSLQATRDLAIRLAALLKPPQLITLTGPLGAGKTTFTQFLATALGCTERITSPSYTLHHQHQLDHHLTLHHLDLYRLQSPDQIRSFELSELINDPKAYTIIEWPEIILPLLPSTALHLYLTRTNQTHTFTLTP